ncbi:hypothetical protein D0862_04162 [Hortaea werneckii]|uniref:DUF676 domain-containing protein n=1 Tax=Hortaea werneckii TaxID=91943 RepID=A0A3M7H3E7_HORWE|nr:hypothetical protein D0862_04162 [Hortaea werneckii]
MLLLHQAGSVKVGEVIRYTLTYTPSSDRILPTPQHLHLKVKNTSAIPLRAAWLHGPYVLHVDAYPSTFNPHKKVTEEEKERYGVPDYEPMLKAGGSWSTKLTVPSNIRETGADLGRRRQSAEQGDAPQSMTWIIEIHSQILFSATASVNFEVLIGRDERSLDLGFAAVAGHGQGAPGRIAEQQASEKERRKARRAGNVQTAGVYSKAVRLVVEDTETLWDKPALPGLDEDVAQRRERHRSTDQQRKSTQQDTHPNESKKPTKKKKIHLVVLTHGLHSNVGADMLFLKESIDATVAQARLDAKKRKEGYRQQEADRKKEGQEASAATSNPAAEGRDNAEGEGIAEDHQDTSTAPLSGGQEELDGSDGANRDSESDDEEETIVRGFKGNAVRTEKGIQYLGKRLAKYILRFTYPDQPFLPVKKPLTRQFTDSFKSDADKAKRDGLPSHNGSSVHHPDPDQAAEELPYTFTSISFVGHSLGGLIQTYAIAYIHKHSPEFFKHIKPINFITMASPMLGLSNENPLYVKFALDFGLVGRTGQDLGLAFRPTTFARGGWNAVIGGLGGAGQKDNQRAEGEDPSSKPLLRILPTGPAHQVLRMFRNRTLYSNVVNDGIVPLRTSCLLFLDWRGLGKVEKARRENGLIGTMAEWGWAELTGTNSTSVAPNVIAERGSGDAEGEGEEARRVRSGEGESVPQPAVDETAEDSKKINNRLSWQGDASQELRRSLSSHGGQLAKAGSGTSGSTSNAGQQQEKGVIDTVLDWFRPSPAPPKQPAPQSTSKKTQHALRRGQTMPPTDSDSQTDNGGASRGTTTNPTMRPHLASHATGQVQPHAKRPAASKGESFINSETGEMQAPPKTSIFESAGDILHPPLPSKQWITDPSSRSRTIFHDRVYHPEDIPPPPAKRPASKIGRNLSSDTLSMKSTGGGSQTSGISGSGAITHSSNAADTGSMKVEEKIARAYHKDLTWRKVLVRLEPDAHNNMIVRRMFANAYGWPVVKHLCDTHFADTYFARTRDESEPGRERAQPVGKPIPDTGEEVDDQTAKTVDSIHGRSKSEMREARDELAALPTSKDGFDGNNSPAGRRAVRNVDSGVWDDSYFEGDEDDDSDVDERNIFQKLTNPNGGLKQPEPSYQRPESKNSSVRTPGTPTQGRYADGHRGLTPSSPSTSKPKSPVESEGPVKSTFDAALMEDQPKASPVMRKDQDVEGSGSLGEGSRTGDDAGEKSLRSGNGD